MKTYILKSRTLASTLAAWVLRRHYGGDVVIADINSDAYQPMLDSILAATTPPRIYVVESSHNTFVQRIVAAGFTATVIKQHYGLPAGKDMEKLNGVERQGYRLLWVENLMQYCWETYGVGEYPRAYAMLSMAKTPMRNLITDYGIPAMVTAYLADRTMDELDLIMSNDDVKWMQTLTHVSTVMKHHNLDMLHVCYMIALANRHT